MELKGLYQCEDCSVLINNKVQRGMLIVKRLSHTCICEFHPFTTLNVHYIDLADLDVNCQDENFKEAIFFLKNLQYD